MPEPVAPTGIGAAVIELQERKSDSIEALVRVASPAIGLDGGFTTPIALSAVLNTRDDLLRPTKGWRAIARAVWDPPGADYEFTRLVLDAGYLYRLDEERRHILGARVDAGFVAGFGNTFEIDHGNGIVTRFAHCSRIAVRNGQRVSRGQLIATVGNTGLTIGPHLHYEVHVNGKPVDPLRYVLPDKNAY